MPVIRKTAHIVVKCLSGLLFLFSAGYVLLLLINWQDAQPNTASKQLQSLLQTAPVAPEHNGYLYFVANSNNHQLTLTGSLFSLSQQCQVAERCQNALSQQENLAELLATKPILQQFYWQLLQYAQWQQPAPVLAEIPPYQPLHHGQQLILWQAWLHAKHANTEQVALIIEADFRFWSTVLENSNMLLSKMISTRALQRHFEFVPFIINQLPEMQRQAALQQVGLF